MPPKVTISLALPVYSFDKTAPDVNSDARIMLHSFTEIEALLSIEFRVNSDGSINMSKPGMPEMQNPSFPKVKVEL